MITLSFRASESESGNPKNMNINKKTIHDMNKTMYEAPYIEVVEVEAEGVLCESGTFEQWEEQDFGW